MKTTPYYQLCRWLLTLGLALFSTASWSQTQYLVLVDIDNNPATGCNQSLPNSGSLSGIERRLIATVSESNSPQVTQLSLESCTNGLFGTPVTVPGAPYPVGINNGVSGADVVEQAVVTSAVAPVGAVVRIYFASQRTDGDDLLASTSGGGPILVNIQAGSAAIPALSGWSLLLLALLLGALVYRFGSRFPTGAASALALLLVLGIAWAAGFALDGQVNDWQGTQPVGTDPQGDSSSQADLVAAFIAQEGGQLFFRSDIREAQTPNHAPSFTKGGDQTVLEDAGAQTLPGWATGISAGSPAEAGQTLTFNVIANTNAGLFSAGPAVAADGTLTFTPASNANGSATLTLTLSDDGGTANGGVDTSAAQSWVINVTPVNDPPSFTAGTDPTVLENAGPQTLTAWATAISAGPANESGQSLTFNLTGNTNPGLFSAGPALATNGTLTFTPASNANGSATLSLTLSDNGGTADGGVDTSAPHSLTITVTSVDSPPVAVNDPATVDEDASATAIAVLANDTDIDGGPISITSVTQPANGTVVITGGGTGLTYAPNANYCNSPPGTTLDTFTYSLTPGGSTATVTVTVNCENDPPVVDLNGPLVAGIDFAATFTEGSGPVAIVDSANLSVSDLDTATLVSATLVLSNRPDGLAELLAVNTAGTSITAAAYNGATGELLLTGSDTLANYQTVLRTLTYNNSSLDPDPTARSISVLVNDGTNDSGAATATVSILAINSVPSFTKGSDPTVLEDAGAQTLAGWATGINDGDGGGQTLTFNITANTNTGLFSAGPAVAADGTLTFTPASNANGSATLTLTLSDDGGTANGGVDTSAAQTWVINVTPVNDSPSFTAGTDPTVLENAGPQTLTAWATAISAGPANESGQSLTFNLTGNTNPSLFSAGPALATNGTLTFTPASNANGSATLSLTLSDNGGTADGGVDTSAPHSLTITVTSVDSAPVAVNDAATLTEDASATAIDVLANDTDIDGGPISITSVTQPANGTVVITGGGTGLTYAPNANYCNTPPGTTLDTFTYSLTPGGSTATVTVTVNCSDDPPVAENDPATVDEDASATAIDVLANDTDIDGGPISITSVTQPANGTVVITGGGTGLTYAPNANYCNNPPGTTLDTFTYSLTPGGSTATVTVTVNCVNDAPSIALPGPAAAYDTLTPAILDAAATVTDSDSLNFDTGALTANVTTNCEDNDRLGVRNEGNGAGQIGVNGADVTYNPGTGAVTIGTLTTEFDCTTPLVPTLVIALNADATPTATQALLRNLTYFSASTPTGTTRSLDVFLTDGDGGTSNTATKIVNLDSAPTVTDVTPANSATGVAINADLTLTFSEAVNVSVGWYQISCSTSGVHAASVSGGSTTFTLNPNTDFANGETCTLTVTATLVTDQDAIDPPDQMATDFTSTFTTVDVAPTVLASSTPVGGTTVPTNQVITLNFSEAVDLVLGNISLTCGTSQPFNASGTSNLTSVTLTPDNPLPAGASCTLTVAVDAATDVDAVDPPDQLDALFTRTFNVDAAPSVTSTSPLDEATLIPVGNNITVNFSEAVNVINSSFTIDCSGLQIFGVTGTGTSNIVLNPTADLPGDVICTVTVVATNVSDVDTVDPPNAPVADYTFSFRTAPVAIDDNYTVTPHLTYDSPTGVGANDDPINSAITGFGPTLGTANGTAPDGTNSIIAGGAGGRVVLNADGTFSFWPDAGDTGPSTATFFYTVTGGDTAQVTLTFETEELVWFIDSAGGPVCTGTNLGTQACPASTLAAVASLDTSNDTLFVASGSQGCGAGITLESGEKLIGEGATGTLSAHSGVTPVAGSTLPTLTGNSGNWPALTSASNCVTLGSNNRILGIQFGNVGAANTALTGTNFGTLTLNETSINTNGRALNLDTGTLAATFTGISSTGGANNLRLNNIAGSADFGTGALSGATDDAFSLTGGAGTFTYGGTINNSSARSVFVNGKTGGTLNFNGAISSTNKGVVLTSNTGATLNFQGGISLSTGTIAAFTATGGGTVNVCDENPCNPAATGALLNNLTTTTGTALNVASTTIGANGLEFRSISSNGATNGIVLNNTGSSGGLAVKGTGTTAGSGGTIQNSTGVGVSLTSTSSVSLSYLNVTNGDNDGIGGSSVTGLSLTGVQITSNGDAAGEAGIDLSNLLGTSTWSGITVSGSAEDNVVIRNSSGVLASLNVTSSAFSNNSAIGNDGFLMDASGTASMTVSVTNSTFAAHRGDHFQAAAANSGVLDVVFSNNGLSGGHATALGQGITISAATGLPGYGGTVDYNIDNNTINGSILSAITANLGTSAAGANMRGTISGNTIGTVGSFQSGSTQASGITVESHGNGTHTTLITNNIIRQTFDRGINVLANDGNGVMNMTVTNNQAVHSDGTNSREGFFINNGSTDPNIFGTPDSHFVCLSLTGNTLTHGPGAPDDFRLRQRFSSTIRLPGYAGAATDTAAVVNFVNTNNTSTTGSATVNSPPGGGFVGGAACPLPP